MLTKKILFLTLPLIAALSLHANDPFFNDPFGDDIFKEMIQMQKNMDKMFERMQHRMNQRSSGLVSPLATYKMAVPNQLVDKGDYYELATNIPESKENHITIDTADGMMHIGAKVVQEKEEKSQYGVSQSRSVKMYQQSTSLPKDADESAITTLYRKGYLIVKIAKKQKNIKTVLPKAVTKDEKKVEKEVNPPLKNLTEKKEKSHESETTDK